MNISGVLVCGSAKSSNFSEEYLSAYQLGFELGGKGQTVITGGGSGIMEAANKGCFEAGGTSVGIGVEIFDQVNNNFCSKDLLVNCKNFQERKNLMITKASAFVFFPGGYGTLDELFEILVLFRTNKITEKPLVLYNTSFWAPFFKWLELNVFSDGYIFQKDLDYLNIVDNTNDIIIKCMEPGR